MIIFIHVLTIGIGYFIFSESWKVFIPKQEDPLDCGPQGGPEAVGPVVIDDTIKRHVVCQFCGKCYAEMRYMLGHQTRHCAKNPASLRNRSVNVKPYQCEDCGAAFSDRSDLTRHIKRDCGRIIECAICGATFSQTSSFYKHLKVHTDPLPRDSSSTKYQ